MYIVLQLMVFSISINKPTMISKTSKHAPPDVAGLAIASTSSVFPVPRMENVSKSSLTEQTSKKGKILG